MTGAGESIFILFLWTLTARVTECLPQRKNSMMQRLLFGCLMLLLGLAAPAAAADSKPIKVLIITGDHGHAWKQTTPFLKDLLTKGGMEVAVTETPAKDLTSDNLAQ